MAKHINEEVVERQLFVIEAYVKDPTAVEEVTTNRGGGADTVVSGVGTSS